jgi:hypothetical protein
MDHCIPSLFHNLECYDDEYKKVFERSIELMQNISVSDEMFLFVTPRMFKQFDSLPQFHPARDKILDSIAAIIILREEFEVHNPKSSKIISSCVVEVTAILVNHYDMLKDLSIIINIIGAIMRNVSIKFQDSLIKTIMSLNGNLGASSHVPCSARLAYLYSAALCNIRPLTPIDIPDLSEFLIQCIYTAINSANEDFCASVGKLASSLVNKMLNHTDTASFLDSFQLKFIDAVCMNDTTDCNEQFAKENILIIYSWITKGLVFQSNPAGLKMTSCILSLICHPTLRSVAIRGFAIVTRADPIISKQSFSKQGLLYNQKLYLHCLPIIANGFEKVESKSGHLKALSLLLQSIPNKSLLAEIPSLFPMLIFSLQSDDPDLKLATISTLGIMVAEASDIVSSQFDLLFVNLAPLTMFKNKDDGNNTVYISNW